MRRRASNLYRWSHMLRTLTLTDSVADKATFALLYEVFLAGGAVLSAQNKRTADDVRKEAKILRRLRAISVEDPVIKTGLGDAQRSLKEAGSLQLPQAEHATLVKYLETGLTITKPSGSVEVVEMLEQVEAMDKVEESV